MRSTIEERSLMAKLVRKGLSIIFVAVTLGFNRKTVSYWSKQDLRARKDLPRLRKGKITVEVEITILYLRATFSWGTARIQQGLMNLPEFMIEGMEICVQNFKLSRTAINNVLKKHKINGYRRKSKSWKFFRAKFANELWQLDLKGPFRVEGKKYWILVCIDDYSRYILNLTLFDHCPKLIEIEEAMKSLIEKHHPLKILTDNHPFDKAWNQWCKEKGTEAVFAHPHYPQDKGKVERTIRNLTEEFIALLSKFPLWLYGKLEEYREWFNKKRFHRGINDYPARLYVQL